MHNHLSSIGADYEALLAVSPVGKVVPEQGDILDQEVDVMDDGDEERISFSTDPVFLLLLPLERLTGSEVDAVMIMYFDPTRANARERSFLYLHSDGYTYVVKFDCVFDLSQQKTNRFSMKNIVLRIAGVFSGSVVWIMATGNWNDAGFWMDTETWNDS